MAQHWERDPATGDYVMEGGSPKQTDSLRIPAFHRVKTQRGRWQYAPDSNYGSDFHTVSKRRTNSDTSNLESMAVAALQPIVDDGRASNIDAETQVVSRHAAGLQITIADARGEVEQLNLPRVN